MTTTYKFRERERCFCEWNVNNGLLIWTHALAIHCKETHMKTFGTKKQSLQSLSLSLQIVLQIYASLSFCNPNKSSLKILFGQRLWGIDSWFSYEGVESWAAINPSYAGQRELSRPRQRYNISWAWRVDPTPGSKPNVAMLQGLVLVTCEHALTTWGWSTIQHTRELYPSLHFYVILFML